ncbi:MAG TPA: isovaleryl-CoA dehydrogenase [Acidimicrobiales bacterium]|jgi:putative acyl-CoA dehydrogenase|nr:isovaleryl-CoA dehydrogenase [Acidimicrobiales bacterium]
MVTRFDTHVVFNQPPPLEDYDVFAADAALGEAVDREGAGWARPELQSLGALAGSAASRELGRLANQHRPVLRTHDRYGHRVDVVDYHPAYHQLMTTSLRHGLHAGPWADPRPGAHVARAAKVIVWYQVDAGHICPVSMTYAVVPALRHQPDVAARWEPMIGSTTYDPADVPASQKSGVTCGMALTEKQGGSDVRANTTRAEPEGDHAGRRYRLTGHKWFCSAPMSDAFLMLAQAERGISCFLVPRWLSDGSRNPIRIQRLKDKLGDRSNASSEIELQGVTGELVGDEGRGVRTIIEMVNHTRLDCILGSASIMRQGVAEATWHAAHRSTFGKVLAEQPLMENVLADLAVESEAATASALRLARAYDGDGDEHEMLLQRLLTPVVKYWTCKRAPQHAAEALECLGGNGYVEDSDLPRLFRQSPVNGVWEGSGNVICLDVLRALSREPDVMEAYWAEVARADTGDARLAQAVDDLHVDLSDTETFETRARAMVERMALVFQASLLVRFAPHPVADAFCASRLGGLGGGVFGTLPAGLDTTSILARHTPV